MHRMILGAEQGMVGDLRDKDGLNNQMENLRVCDRSQNVMGAARYRLGASRYKGMDLHRGKWRARICAYGQRLNLGHYETEVEPVRAYDRAADNGNAARRRDRGRSRCSAEKGLSEAGLPNTFRSRLRLCSGFAGGVRKLLLKLALTNWHKLEWAWGPKSSEVVILFVAYKKNFHY
jgi:hypothetical protein